MPFIGVMNASDGTFIYTYKFSSPDPSYSVGYSSTALEMDSTGALYAGISFLNSAPLIVRLASPWVSSSGVSYSATLTWAAQIATNWTIENN